MHPSYPNLAKSPLRSDPASGPGSPEAAVATSDAGTAGLLSLADALPVCISCLDHHYRYRYVNRAYEEQFHVPVSHIVGRQAQEILGERLFAELRPFADRALRGEHLQFEHSLPHPTDGIREIRVHLGPWRDPALASVGILRGVADRALRQLKSTARSLIPLDLSRDPFSRWVQQLAADLELLFPIECRTSIAGEIEDPIVATQLYRIVQEAVTNVGRHAQASTVRIELAVDDDVAVLTIDDDGQWSEHPEAGPGMGLETMRHRARALGGRLSISPGPSGGTRVSCRIPARFNHPEPPQGGTA